MGELLRRGCPAELLGLPVIRKMQVQGTRSSHFPPNQMGNKSESQVMPSARKAMEQELVGLGGHSLGGAAVAGDPAMNLGHASWEAPTGCLSQPSMQQPGNAVWGWVLDWEG